MVRSKRLTLTARDKSDYVFIYYETNLAWKKIMPFIFYVC